MNGLTLPKEIREAIVCQADAESPFECCGLLAGDRDGRVNLAIPLRNELQSPIAFRSEARSMLAAMRSIDESGLHWLAVYHSHPTSRPVPSRKDRQEHVDSAIACVIVGRENGEWIIRAWRMDGEPCELEIHERS